MGDVAIAQNAPVVKEQIKNRQDASRQKEQKRETSLHDLYSNMPGSIFVNGFTTPGSGADFSQVPVRPSLRTGPMIQRSCKGDSTCSCSECSKNLESGSADVAGNEEMSLQESMPEEQSVDQSPVDEISTDTSETSDTFSDAPVSEQESSTDLLVSDSATDLSEGQMKKTEFLQQVRSGICGAIEPILATKGQTTDGCPYLNYWLDLYQQKDISEIESTVKRYATGSSSARTAQDYIALIVQRATRSAEIWASTGRLSGIPEGVPTTPPNEAASSANTVSPAVQAKAKNGGAKKTDNPLVIQSELGNGQPLEGSVRSRMESAFGMNFSHVRAHTDTNASELSNRVNARAFTVGNHVAFGSGEYKPGTMLGDALIAHELAHTIQQSGSENSVDKMEVGTAGYNQLENDADQSAMGVVSSLWGEAKEGLKGMAQRTMPMLRSGLKIQRCKSDPPATTGVSTTDPGATTATPTPVTPTTPTARANQIIIKSKTVSTKPADLTRLKLGIGEEVDCSIDPPGAATWSLTGDGSLSTLTGPTTRLTVSQSPSNPVIKADFGGKSGTKTFEVIAPDGMTSSVKSNEILGTPGPPNNQIGSKTIFDCVVKPDIVSFYNAKFRENIPLDNWTWPDGSAGSNGPKIVPWSVGFDNKTTDTVTSALRPISKINDGTKFVDFGYTIHVPEDYQDKGGNWVTWLAGEEHLKQFRGADQKGKSTLIATNTLGGDWSGPWQ